MMKKKIKSIKQLKAEKKRLVEQQLLLEERMRGNWSALKEGLSPANIAKDTIGSFYRGVTNMTVNKEGIIKGAIALGVGLLAKKITQRAGARLKKMFTK